MADTKTKRSLKMKGKTQTYLVDGGKPAQPQTVLTDILPMVLVHSLVLPVSKEETIQRYNRVIITVCIPSTARS